MKKLRQGQTIYFIRPNYLGEPYNPTLEKIFLHSHKTPLPPMGCIVEKVPVTVANDALARGFQFFTSRRKAERAFKRELSQL